jgi:hypothetical protein
MTKQPTLRALDQLIKDLNSVFNEIDDGVQMLALLRAGYHILGAPRPIQSLLRRLLAKPVRRIVEQSPSGNVGQSARKFQRSLHLLLSQNTI